MPEHDAFDEWDATTDSRQFMNAEEWARAAYEAGARSRNAEVEWTSYQRGYETGCAAASYTNEESNLAQIHVLEQDLDQLHKVRSAELDELASVHQERNRLREALRDLSHQLNRHRCGNWEPELKAADERARAVLGEEG